MSFKILKNNCCGLDVHKTWIYACIGITDPNNRTEYKQARLYDYWREESTTRYRRIKARCGYKKAIIAICRMILTTI